VKRERSAPRRAWFAGLSRRVRQPLGGLLEEFAALLENADDDKQRALLELARGETHALLALINEILDLTRLEEGNFVLARETFDLWDLLDGVQDDLLRECRRRGANCEFLLHPETPAVAVGDPGRLRQLLAHLASLGPTDAPPADVLLTAAPVRENPDSFAMRFSAQFPAAATANRRRDWLMLLTDDAAAEQRLRQDPTPAVLRAALVRRLAVAMGGTLAAAVGEAEMEAWCTIALGRRTTRAAVAADHPAKLEGMRVLLLDSDGERAGRWRAAFSDWGCRVKMAASFAGALTAMRRAATGGAPLQAAVVFCDRGGQAAEDFGRAALTDVAMRGPALLLVAATGRRGDAARLREIGFAAYLTEPVEPSLLLRALAVAAPLAERAPAKQPAAIITRHSLRELRFRQLQIGVIDGNPVHCLVMLRLLENLGCRAHARRVDEIDLLLGDDLLFVDVGQAREVISALSRGLRQPAVIGMAPPNRPGSRKPRRIPGMLEIIGKPIHASVLREAIERYLKERQAPRRKATTSPLVADLLARFDCEAGAVDEILALFLKEFAQNLSTLDQDLAAGRGSGAREAATTMAESAACLGLERLPSLLADLARAATAGRREEARAKFKEVVAAFAEIQEKVASC